MKGFQGLLFRDTVQQLDTALNSRILMQAYKYMHHHHALFHRLCGLTSQFLGGDAPYLPL